MCSAEERDSLEAVQLLEAAHLVFRPARIVLVVKRLAAEVQRFVETERLVELVPGQRPGAEVQDAAAADPFHQARQGRPFQVRVGGEEHLVLGQHRRQVVFAEDVATGVAVPQEQIEPCPLLAENVVARRAPDIAGHAQQLGHVASNGLAGHGVRLNRAGGERDPLDGLVDLRPVAVGVAGDRVVGPVIEKAHRLDAVPELEEAARLDFPARPGEHVVDAEVQAGRPAGGSHHVDVIAVDLPGPRPTAPVLVPPEQERAAGVDFVPVHAARDEVAGNQLAGEIRRRGDAGQVPSRALRAGAVHLRHQVIHIAPGIVIRRLLAGAGPLRIVVDPQPGDLRIRQAQTLQIGDKTFLAGRAACHVVEPEPRFVHQVDHCQAAAVRVLAGKLLHTLIDPLPVRLAQATGRPGQVEEEIRGALSAAGDADQPEGLALVGHGLAG